MKRFNLLRETCLVIALFFIIPNAVHSQNYDLLDIPFEENGVGLKNPFTGGFEGPQFCNIDLNRDGIQDLYVFDRRGDVKMFFINDGLGNGSNSFTYAPEYLDVFPESYGWIHIVDFNNDGVEDIFTTVEFVNSISVFYGRIVNGKLSFERYFDPNFLSGKISNNILNYQFSSGYPQIEVPGGDRPAVDDFDGDGDLDIAAFGSGTHILYYKNICVENNIPLDSLVYELSSECFGGIFESGLDEAIFLSPKPDSCSSGFWSGDIGTGDRHAGSTLLAFDEDGDNDMELLVGDLSSSKMVMLRNGGTPTNTWFNEQDPRFPSYDFSIDLDFFPGAFYEDMDNDNIRELLVAPNGINTISNVNNIWLYENIGEDDQTDFRLIQKNFLSETSIDQGDHSVPSFVDVNQDGLTDLLIASEGAFLSGSVHTIAFKYYKNIGSPSSPEFTLEDDDYLNFSEYANTSAFPAPAFGDMDNDNDIDMIIGDAQGQMYYFENRAGEGNEFSFANPIYQWMGIDIGIGANPKIYDLDKDGLNDIIMGKRDRFSLTNPSNPDDVINSHIGFFKNIGTPESPMFEPNQADAPNNPSLGGMNVKTNFANNGYATPYLVKSGDETLILSGSDDGRIFIYKSNKDSLEFGRFELLDDQLGDIKEGRQTSISLADIDDDGWYEMAVGNFRGGIAIYNTIIRTDGQITAIEEETVIDDLKVYPNPTRSFFHIELPDLNMYQLYNSNGILVKTANYENTIDMRSFGAGVYFLKAYTNNRVHSAKLIKIE